MVPLTFEMDGKLFRVEIDPSSHSVGCEIGETRRLIVDGIPYTVLILEQDRVEINGQIFPFSLGEETVRFKSLTYSPRLVKVGDYSRNQLGAKIQMGPQKSPLSGNIWKILKKEGEEVFKGEVILIIEAMKMENEICSPEKGRIESIQVNEGETISVGKILFHLI